MNTIRVLFIGDVVGALGRAMFAKHIAPIKVQYAADAIIVNGENSAPSGRGITPKNVQFFKNHGVDIITSGNHIWDSRDIYPYFAQHKDLLRPANFPRDCPGSGIGMFECKGRKVAVLNVQGRVFMREDLSCPFREAQSALTYISAQTPLIFVDFHAEATSEKIGLAYFLDGKVSAVVGTHTHVQTADETILPGGTAYITDLGMVGALDGMLGMKKEPIIQRFLTQMPVRFQPQEEGPAVLTGVCIEVDTADGRAISIERIKVVDAHITLSEWKDE
jgi:2',3'-cyclic-nucleotide 2'-phosphodiesterase